MNRSITSKEIEQAVKNFATKKSPEPNDFTGKCYLGSMPIIFKLFQKLFLVHPEEEGTLPNSLTMPALPLYQSQITTLLE